MVFTITSSKATSKELNSEKHEPNYETSLPLYSLCNVQWIFTANQIFSTFICNIAQKCPIGRDMNVFFQHCICNDTHKSLVIISHHEQISVFIDPVALCSSSHVLVFVTGKKIMAFIEYSEFIENEWEYRAQNSWIEKCMNGAGEWERHGERYYVVKRNVMTKQWGIGFIANMNIHTNTHKINSVMSNSGKLQKKIYK